jgi:hypothetical protein
MENDAAVFAPFIMSQWVIYDHPRDDPDHYVMRRWEIRGSLMIATADVAQADTLEEIRQAIPPGLYCLPRFAEDDPCIVEVWL